jgi:hypothetical protein
MRILVRATLAAAVLLVWLIPQAQAQTPPRGSYLRTCPEASVYRGRLTAVCRRGDGSFQQSSLADVGRCVGDIGNFGGRLRCHYGPARPLPGGSYQQSCTDTSLNGNTLAATCRTRKQRAQRTSLANVDRCVGDIANIDGKLRCNTR